MSDLERDLRMLGVGVDWPATPDLATVVRERVDARPPRRSWLPAAARLAPALAVVLAVVATTLAAVEPVRSAVLEFFGIAGGERVVRRDELPDLPRRDPALGELTTLQSARSQTTFPVRLPRRLGPPGEVRISRELPGGAVSLVYGERFVITQIGGGRIFAEKQVGAATRVEQVEVEGARGLFITGAPHVYFVVAAGREGNVITRTGRLVDANVLLWDSAGVAHRIETTAGLREALAVARSLR